MRALILILGVIFFILVISFGLNSQASQEHKHEQENKAMSIMIIAVILLIILSVLMNQL
jgi:heme/copper-type cytochrome/quinol oxidase subunit 2